MPDLPLSRVRSLLRGSIAFIWLWTALVCLVFARPASYALLARTGITGPLAAAALYGTSLFEVALGLAVAAGPPRWTRPLAAFQAAVIVAFTLVITAAPGVRDLWLSPVAPVAKNVPILGALLALYALGEKR